jgi:Cu/Ag efflux pump CusA
LIDASNGGHVRLGEIAQVTVRPDPVDIRHEAVSRYVDVSAEVYGRSVGSASSEIRSRLGRISYPLEYHAEIQGGTPDAATSHAVFVSFVLAAVIGIFLLLQSAIGSWRLAMLLFLVIPVGLSGGVIVALAAGETGSVAAYAGLLGVVAIAVRQAVVLASQVRRHQAAGDGVLTRELVARAAAQRFGPALGSAGVSAAVLLPFVVIGNVAGNELTHTAAAVLLGGLATSTFVNLLILPAVQLTLGPAEPLLASEPEDASGWQAPAASQSS